MNWDFFIRGEIMEKRLGFVGVIVEDRRQTADQINRLLSKHGNIVLARVGLPYREKDCSVITLIVDATTDELGALTGELGGIAGVSIKSALAKQKTEK